jgi:hypothetical protein
MTSRVTAQIEVIKLSLHGLVIGSKPNLCSQGGTRKRETKAAQPPSFGHLPCHVRPHQIRAAEYQREGIQVPRTLANTA